MVPVLAERLGIPGVPVAAPGSEAARFYQFEATTRFLRHAAAAQPLLVVLEDLHAADEASLLLLQFLARQLRGARLLVVGTYRDVDADRQPAVLDAVGQLVREGQLVTLGGLERDEVKGLMEALSGVAPSAADVNAVHETTDGNPLFVREVVRLLASEAAGERPARRGVPIPRSVRVAIQRRLAPLSADAVGVLSAAAVIGREFDLALLTAACELPGERVLVALSEAAALGMVAEAEGAVGGYRFSHSLVREVLCEQLPLPDQSPAPPAGRRDDRGGVWDWFIGPGCGTGAPFRRGGGRWRGRQSARVCPKGRRAGHGHARLRAGRRRVSAGAGGVGIRRRRRHRWVRVAAAAGCRPGESGRLSPRRGELPAGRGDQQEAWSARAAGTRRPGLGRTSGRGRHRQPAARGATRGGTPGPGDRRFAASRPAAGPAVPGAHLLGRDRPHEVAQRRSGRHGPSAGRSGGATHGARYPLDGGVGPGRAGGAHRAGRRGAATGAGDRRPGDGAGRSRRPGGHLARVR